jgi:hypothetical protein
VSCTLQKQELVLKLVSEYGFDHTDIDSGVNVVYLPSRDGKSESLVAVIDLEMH